MRGRWWARGIREVTGAVPSSRGRAAPALPRWVRDPVVSDFADAARCLFEATSGERGDGLGSTGHALSRFMHALDLLYGPDQWALQLAKPPRWPGTWMPGTRYDPTSYEVLPDGPPEWLRAAVEAHQAEEDEQRRQIVAQNSFPGYRAQMLVRLGVPPAALPAS
jgi:hypothetical protein